MAARNFGIVPYDAINRDPVNTNTFSQEKKKLQPSLSRQGPLQVTWWVLRRGMEWL